MAFCHCTERWGIGLPIALSLVIMNRSILAAALLLATATSAGRAAADTSAAPRLALTATLSTALAASPHRMFSMPVLPSMLVLPSFDWLRAGAGFIQNPLFPALTLGPLSFPVVPEWPANASPSWQTRVPPVIDSGTLRFDVADLHPGFEVRNPGGLHLVPHGGPSALALSALDGRGIKGVGGAGVDDPWQNGALTTPGPLGFSISF